MYLLICVKILDKLKYKYFLFFTKNKREYIQFELVHTISSIDNWLQGRTT